MVFRSGLAVFVFLWCSISHPFCIHILKDFKNAQLPNFRFSNAHSFYILLYTPRTVFLSFFQQYLMLSNLVYNDFNESIKGDNSAFFQTWFKQIHSLFYCCWGSKVAEWISLKFTVRFDDLRCHFNTVIVIVFFTRVQTLCSENGIGRNE